MNKPLRRIAPAGPVTAVTAAARTPLSNTIASAGPMGDLVGPAAKAAADLVGSGCSGSAEQVPTGAGSVSGMVQDPVVGATGDASLVCGAVHTANATVYTLDTALMHPHAATWPEVTSSRHSEDEIK